ncbi:hypothetical protein L227DRAFT_558236 [Lentinus tigrinus ALCF2SS1-6]|uniref:Fungal-type protein kinase domain-containing protein n=1 Tax=Lentinus tigrinus ALCF2SS1-6 TaxID=1328759 RepID=A0A5C2RMY1_9APHY|nr:hypothetical protein L227DRAFT_558236 [Lentinus tigrinus ALCF2SS1-6]
MSPRFFETPVEAVLSKVPGSLPTAEQRKLFKRADFSRAKYKNHVYSLLTTTIDSVFTAASVEKVCVRLTDGRRHRKRADTLDVGIYLNTPAAVKATTTDAKPTGKGGEDAGDSTDEDSDEDTGKAAQNNAREDGDADGAPPSHISWHWVAIPIEVKHNRDHAAFHFSKVPPTTHSKHSSSSPNASKASSEPKSFVPVTLQNEKGYIQFIDHMSEVFDNQHRRFSYAIYVWDYMARICFFDRGGAVISEEFNWTTPDSPLHDFLWKVAHMSEAQLGYDPTVERVSDEDAAAFKRIADDSTVHEKIRSFVKQAIPEGQPIYKVDIIPMGAPPDEGFPDDPFPPPSPADPSSAAPASPPSQPPVAPTPRSFLIGNSLIGRSTRGYIAYDIDGERLCFLKDYWRPYVPNRTRPEHMIYERMARCGVEGIPTLICGGDVGGMRAQTSQIQDILCHPDGALPVPLFHYRIANVEIGLPLESFMNFKQLALVFADAVLTHCQAWEKARILHCDINTGNILIDPYTFKGILIDWDLCRLACELESGPTRPNRAGTWGSRSALVAMFPKKPYRLCDDLESFVHVFNFLVLKYYPIHDYGLCSTVEYWYESCARVRGIKVGGGAKLALFKCPRPPFTVWANDALQNIITDLHNGCYESYLHVDKGRMQDLYGVRDPDLYAVEVHIPQQCADAPVDFRPRRRIPIPTPLCNTTKSTSTDRGDTSQSSRSTGAEATTTAASDAIVKHCNLPGFLSDHRFLYQVLSSVQGKKLPAKQKNQFVATAHQEPGFRVYYAESSMSASSDLSASDDDDDDDVGYKTGDKRPLDDDETSDAGSEDVELSRESKRMRK